MLMFIFYLKGYIMVEFAHSFWSKPLFNNKFSDIKTYKGQHKRTYA